MWKFHDINMLAATYEICCTLSVSSSRDIWVNSYLTPLQTVMAQRPYKLILHPTNVYQCCPLPSLRNSNKLHSVQHVKQLLTEV